MLPCSPNWCVFTSLQNDIIAKMKTAMAAATSLAGPILCGLLAVLPFASAQTSTMTVPFGGIDFVVDTYVDGEETTYEVITHATRYELCRSYFRRFLSFGETKGYGRGGGGGFWLGCPSHFSLPPSLSHSRK